MVAVFYLGTHMPHWLNTSAVPLFVSHRRLQRDKSVPKAVCRWALDSGGFTELAMFGEWRTSPVEYVDACRRYVAEVGMLDWAAPQDWMVEPHMIARTGRTVADHQRLTTDSYHTLHQLAPDVPFIPVLQGWELGDYLDHVEQYANDGIDLAAFDTVGIGSVCRRQDTEEIGAIVSAVAALGIRLHGFGVKGAGIRKYGQYLRSADSLAWSYRGRHIRPCPHTGAKTCANCRLHALEWRDRVLQGM